MSSQRSFSEHSKRFVDADLTSQLNPEGAELECELSKMFKHKPYHWQIRAIQSLFLRHDVLVKAGTGAGKSFIFEVMAKCRSDAIVLVISPLLALMENMVLSLILSFRCADICPSHIYN